jgi:hypothetical protein
LEPCQHLSLAPPLTIFPLNLLLQYHVDLSAPFRPPHPRVVSQVPLRETSVLVCCCAERPLADATHPRTHRLHRVTNRSPASQTTTAPWRDHGNDAGAPRIPKPQTRHARERPPPQHLRAGAPQHDGHRRALRIRQGAFPKQKKFKGVLRPIEPRFSFSFVVGLWGWSSLWTNRTGTFIIGLRANGHRLSDGQTRKFSRS